MCSLYSTSLETPAAHTSMAYSPHSGTLICFTSDLLSWSHLFWIILFLCFLFPYWFFVVVCVCVLLCWYWMCREREELSAVCMYSLEEITKAMDGPFKELKKSCENWINPEPIPTPRPGQVYNCNLTSKCLCVIISYDTCSTTVKKKSNKKFLWI